MSLSFASVKDKARVLNLIYRLTNSIYGNKVKIERDPLHKKYEVNRFGVYLSSNVLNSKIIENEVGKALKEKLNTGLDETLFNSDGFYHKTKSNRKVNVSMNRDSRQGKLYIMVH
jgi:hypothetical protein